MTVADAPKLQVGGTLSTDRLYIRRPEDDEAFNLLVAGEYCNVLTSRQMGKSSLMVRLMARLMDGHDARIATIDMAGDLGRPPDADAWYSGFVHKIADDLALDDDIAAWWRGANGTPNERLLRFFRELVAPRSAEPVFVFVDEIDATLNLPYSDDLFTALRSMYNQRATVPEYKKITFCLLGVASPGELIKERRTTPYNIGQTITLRDFDPSRDDFGELVEALSAGGAPGKELLDAVLGWTGGHPFLTIALCKTAIDTGVKSAGEIEPLARSIIAGKDERFDPGPADQLKHAVRNHFEFIAGFLAMRLHNEGAALRLYDSILRGRQVIDEGTLVQRDLRLSGLVRRDADKLLVVRNRLYAERFGRAWLAQTGSMKAYALTIRLAVGLSLALSLGVGALVYYQSLQSGETDRAARVLDLVQRLNAASDLSSADGARSEACDLIQRAPATAASDTEKGALRQAWESYWKRRADATDGESRKAIQEGDVERGLVLAARAAVQRGDALQREAREKYEEMDGPSLVSTLVGHTGAVNRVRFLGAGRLVSIGIDDTLRLFDVETGKEVKRVVIEGLSTGIDVCADGTCVLTARSPMRGDLWNAELDWLTSFSAEKPKNVLAMAIGARDKQGTWFAAGGKRGASQGDPELALVGLLTTDRWPAPPRPAPGGDPGTGTAPALASPVYLLHASGGRVAPVFAVDFSRLGDKLVTAATDGVRIFNLLGTGRSAKVLVHGQAYDARFSDDGTWVVAATEEKSIVFNAVTGGEVQRRGGSSITGVLSRNNRNVLNAGAGGEQDIVVWGVKDAEVVFSKKTASRVRDAEWGALGEEEIIASAHEDGKIRVWRLTPEPASAEGVALWKLWQRKFGVWESTEPGGATGKVCPP